MKISYNWLKDYINIDLDYNTVAKILTDIGLEVENIEHFESVKGGLEGIVVGEVKTCSKHPDADKLSITKVDIGSENLLDIVCGAPNVATGQKVLVATIGTTLYNGEEPWTIKKSKIRSAVSEGMICAEDELGLGISHDGIMVLPADVKIGLPAKEYFKVYQDIVFEIGLTPNRIDAASHFGVARDLYAYLKVNTDLKVELKLPDTSKFKVENTNNKIEVVVENSSACPRYAGITVSNLEVKESPEWLKNRLKAIGLKPISNVVDITNYVLQEIGHPLHAFDADKISGKKIIVKTLAEGTKFTTLDEAERQLSSDDLMICNVENGMCIGGVFGGLESGVNEKTKNIFIECAYFNPVWVRKTAKRHMLSTDSSFRFERGVDVNNTIWTLKRTAQLINEIAGGQISCEIVDIYPNKINSNNVELSFSQVDRLIGKKIGNEKIKKIINALEIKIIEEKIDRLLLEIPTYRVDVTREADVIEDILRIYGYNNVEIPESVNSSLSYAPEIDFEKLRNKVSDYLSSNGFNETMSNSLTKDAYYQNLETYKVENTVKILNPLSQDLNAMRQTLLYGGLEAVERNIRYKNSDLKLYEFGNCYFYLKDKEEFKQKYYEQQHLGIFISGNKNEINWKTPEQKTDFYYLKSYSENILKYLNFNLDEFETQELTDDVFNYAINYKINNQIYLTLGSVKKSILKKMDIEQDVFYADFEWEKLLLILPTTNRYKPLPKYPEVRRDLALLIDENISFKQIKELAYKTEKNYLKKVSIFDVYKGEKLGADKKSYAVSFVLQDEDKTFTDKQIEKIMQKLMDVYKNELNAVIR
jgi:phenylalanyl-tRNA synthetase beta chain